jgi:hypothetical protein
MEEVIKTLSKPDEINDSYGLVTWRYEMVDYGMRMSVHFRDDEEVNYISFTSIENNNYYFDNMYDDGDY